MKNFDQKIAFFRRALPQKLVDIGSQGIFRNFYGSVAKNGSLKKVQRGDPLGRQVVEFLEKKRPPPPHPTSAPATDPRVQLCVQLIFEQIKITVKVSHSEVRVGGGLELKFNDAGWVPQGQTGHTTGNQISVINFMGQWAHLISPSGFTHNKEGRKWGHVIEG